MKSAVRTRDQRVVELQVEADQLREQAARQNAVVSSLKKRIQVQFVFVASARLFGFPRTHSLLRIFAKREGKITSRFAESLQPRRRLLDGDFQELEDRERNLYASQGRTEITMQGLQRDVKYHEDKVREYEKKIRQLEHNISEEIQLKERARLNLQVAVSAFRSSRLIFDLSALDVAAFFTLSRSDRTLCGDWRTR